MDTGGAVSGTRLEQGKMAAKDRSMSQPNPFRSFKTSPEIIRLAVMLHVRFPLSLRNVEAGPRLLWIGFEAGLRPRDPQVTKSSFVSRINSVPAGTDTTPPNFGLVH